MKKYIIENKKTITIISIFIIFLIILNIVVKSLGNNNKVLISYYISRLEIGDITLDDQSCDLDYTLKYNNIPYFNLSNKTFDEINQEILEEILLRSCYQEGNIDYESSLNDNILSLAINISHETIDDLAYLEYKTYNIDINKNERLTNQEILNLYNLTKNDVSNKVISYLKEYYDYEKENNLLDSDITFNKYLNILDYKSITLNNMNLYIDDKKDLYIFKDYTLSEGMIIDLEYPNLTIKFKLN